MLLLDWLVRTPTRAVASSITASVVFLVLTLRALLIKPFLSQVRTARIMRELAPQLRLLLLPVIVDDPFGLHFLDLLQAADGFPDGIEIGQGASQPAPGHIMLTAGFGRFFDCFLRLLFRAHEEHLAAFAHRFAQKITGRFESGERFAEVDNVDAIARIEDERFHLRVPAFGLMSEMDACFQQFFYADTNHDIFLLLKTRAH